MTQNTAATTSGGIASKPPFELAYSGNDAAPELTGLTNWINSKPLTLADLK